MEKLATFNWFLPLLISTFLIHGKCLGQDERQTFIFDSLLSSFSGSRFTDQQKVYLHVDRPNYFSGETIWFKAYLVRAAGNQLDNRSGGLTVEVIEPEGTVIISDVYKLAGGTTSGSIGLPDTLKTGQYVLRAYTNWMRNFDPAFYWTQVVRIDQISENEIVNISQIESTRDSTLLKFYPEGGYLLNGVPCQVGFKATDSQGQGVEVNGEIIDSNGVRVTSFSSIHQGTGSFFFTPGNGKNYLAVVNNISYPLPKALSSGMVMFAFAENQNAIRVSIRGSKNFNHQYFHLLGQSNGAIQYSATGKLKDYEALAVINTDSISPGILQLTLFDHLGRPQAERLLFVQPRDIPDVEIAVNRNGCEPRQQIEVDIDLQGVRSELSIAVTDPGQVQIPPYADNIYTHFYLTSDLKGEVPTPGFYLKDQTKNTLRALDVLLLTHGWRRFTWKDILEGPATLENGFQSGISLSGTAIDKSNNKPIEQGAISLIELTNNNALHLAFTDTEGKFQFDGLDINKGTWGVFKVNNARGKPDPSIIKLDSLEHSPVIPPNIYQRMSFPGNQSFLKQAETRRQIDLIFDTTEMEYLDPVVVSAERTNNNLVVTELHHTADAVIENDGPNYGTIFDLMRGKVAGLNVISRSGITTISMRDGVPLILLNGIPLNPVGGSVGSGDLYKDLLSIHPTDVERIEVLKTVASANIYGFQGYRGVIAIYTKGVGDTAGKTTDFNRVRLPGYYWGREFYTPSYQGDLKSNPKPDRRATLHWLPSVKTDDTGKARFSFYNSDIACDLDIVVQGLSKEGQPIYFYGQQ